MVFMKKYAMALVALAIATGSLTIMSFKAEKAIEPENPTWEYKGESTDPLDYNEPENYQPAAATLNCTGGQEVCSIEAPEDTENPGRPLIEEDDNVLSQTGKYKTKLRN